MEEDDLSEKQREELRELLQSTISELEPLLASFNAASEIIDLDQPIGRLSRMDELQRQAMSKANRHQLIKKLNQSKQALALWEDYGYCRSCEEPVGYKRLKARPETPYCLECQSARE